MREKFSIWTNQTQKEAVAKNLQTELLKDAEFDMNNVFKKPNSEDKYITVRNLSEYADGIVQIMYMFLPRYNHVGDDIKELMGVPKDVENPDYAHRMWRIPLFAAIPIYTKKDTHSKEPTPEELDGNKKLMTASEKSSFNKKFKEIEFQELENLEDSNFEDCLDGLSRFLDTHFGTLEYHEVARLIYTSFGIDTMFNITIYDSMSSTSEQELQMAFNVHFFTPVIRFFESIIDQKFQNLPSRIQRQTVRTFWESLSRGSSKLSESLGEYPLASGPVEDISSFVKFPDGTLFPLCLIEMKTSALGRVLSKALNSEDHQRVYHINKMRKVFRQVLYYMLNKKLNFFILSDFRYVFYFELPTKSPTWVSSEDGTKIILKSPCKLKYRIIDNMSRSNRFTTQALIAAKVFESLCAAGCTTKQGQSLSNFHFPSDPAIIGKQKNPSRSFKNFARGILRVGFKENHLLLEDSDSDSDPDGIADDEIDEDQAYFVTHSCENSEEEDPIDDSEGERISGNAVATSKRQKREEPTRTSEQGAELLGNGAYLTLINPKEYIELWKCAGVKSVKFLIPKSEILERAKFIHDVETSEELVFIKVFDFNHVRNVYYAASEIGKLEGKNRTDGVVMRRIDTECDSMGDIITRSDRSYKNELRVYRRIIEYNREVTDAKFLINCPKLLLFGIINLTIDENHGYLGPFLMLEYLPFVERKPTSVQEKKNLEQQLENMKRAGISHEDLATRNMCCDEEGKAYLFDFERSALSD